MITIRAEFVRLVDIHQQGIANAFDDMVQYFVDRPRLGLPARTQAAAALLKWATAEANGGEGSLALAGYDLARPGAVASAMGTYSHPRVWAALCGASVR